MTSQSGVVADRYQLLDELGSGAMGIVWRAHDDRLNRVVALKELRLQQGFTEQEAIDAKARALREGRIAGRLQHPNAISVFDVFTDPDRSGDNPWLVMEYLPSRSLAAVLAELGPLEPPEVARIGHLLAQALTAAHRAGIVHRDVKPGNVLLGDDGMVKITDFGIARATWDVVITRTGMVAGTPAYFAPEVARGAPTTFASDVFSLGATLYAAVEGVPPFGPDIGNALALLRAVSDGQVTPPRRAGPLTAVLMTMLRADPEQRPSMTEVARALGTVVASCEAAGTVPVTRPDGGATLPLAPERRASPAARDRTVSDTAVPPPAPAPDSDHPAGRPSGHRRWALTATGLVVFVLLGLGGWLLLNDDESSPNPDDSAAQSSSAPPVPAQDSQQSDGATDGSAESGTAEPDSAAVSDADIDSTDVATRVRAYYALLPEDPARAWTFLGAPERSKANGYEGYLRFWSGIRSVDITGTPEVNGRTVLLDLRFVTTSGAVSLERYRLEMSTDSDDHPLIESAFVS